MSNSVKVGPWCCAVVGALIAVGVAAAIPPSARYTRYDEVRSIVAPGSIGLPADLRNRTASQLQAAWPVWIEQHDRANRGRLAQGDEDTIVNWLLFGTSFTSQPRAIIGAVAPNAANEFEAVRRTAELIGGRAQDFVQALVSPAGDERRLFARRLLERRGLGFETPTRREAVIDYLMTALTRVAREQEQTAQEIRAGGGSTGEPGDAEFAALSRVYHSRGLSLDTSLAPNYALEETLAAMKTQGLLRTGAVRKIAIVGPGLDFADKDAGFDFFPQQTVQPFAILDSLLRLGLVRSLADVEMTVLDISPRVIEHISRAKARAVDGTDYTLYLPLARGHRWLPGFRRYWQVFGDRIGAATQAPISKAIADQSEVRAVRVRASTVKRMSVADLNIVTQRLDSQRFDLIAGTNIFVYYDAFDQALAEANVGAMLEPGGFLLSNTLLPDLSSILIRSPRSHTTLYSSANDGDHIVWYRRP
jgi:hypothetical protein